MQKLLDGLQKLGAIKIGEAGVGYFDNYHFKLNGRRVGVIFEEYRSLKLIAPPEIIKSIENELGIRAVYLSIRQFSN